MLTRTINSALLMTVLAMTDPASASIDTDGDGITDSVDNCSEVSNADQRNTDGDAYGNICDPDFDNDGQINFADLSYIRSVFFTADPDGDLDGSGIINYIDLAIMRAMFFGSPGPGAVAAPVTFTNDIQPIFFEKCGLCHTQFNIGGHNIGSEYADAFLPAGTCFGMNMAECSLVRIQDGTMPQGQGCTGDPALDAGNSSCLTQGEQDAVQAWIDAGLPE